MADYKINILAQVTGLDKAEQQIRNILKLNGETVRINVETGKLDQQIQQIQKGMTSSGKVGGTNFSKGFVGSVKTIKAPTLKEVVNLNKRIKSDTEKALKDIKIFDPGIDQNVAKKSASQYVNQKVKAEQKAQAEVEKIQQQSIKQQEKEYTALKNKADKILYDYQTKSLQVQDAQMQAGIRKYAGLNQESIDRYNSAFSDRNRAIEAYNSDRSVKNMERLIDLNNDYSKSMKTLGNEFKIASTKGDDLVSAKKVADFQRGLQKYWDDNNRMHNTMYGKNIQSMFDQLNSGGITNSQMKKLESQAANIKKSVDMDGLGGKSFISTMGSQLKSVGQILSTYDVIQAGINQIGNMANNVLDINSAMIELRKVSTASDVDIADYYDEAAASAKKYGASIDEVINSTADWSRLGYGLDEAKELSNATTLLQRVGDNMTQESSSQGLISTLKGFSKEADEATAIVDAANEVANTQPIDTAGIFSALQRSASSLSAAGNTYQESMAMITAANSVVQDPDTVGTAFKTMSMRIRGASTELQEAGLDTEGMATSTAKLREEMIALSGVDIMKDPNTFKSTYQILDELADRWSGLTDIQQANTCLSVQKCA